MTDILMPALSDQMEEGTIIKWLIDDGEPVEIGDELVEIETDKATMTWDSEFAGVLHIVAAEDSTVAVGEIIATVGVADEAGTQAPAPRPESSEPAPAEAAPVETAAPEPVTMAASNGGTVATPLARRAAAVHDVTLADLEGSGPRGRITKADVLRSAGIEVIDPVAPTPAPAAAATPASPTPAKDGVTVREPTRLQKTIAKRMAEATATVPHFQVQTEVVMNDALALRAELKAIAGDDPVPSVNDIIMKACALVLRDHPLVNGSYRDEHYELHDRVHMGMAVASDDGLVVATVPDADVSSLGEIARRARRLAARVRDGEATAAELSGATFTVSNLGMFGMTAITAVINPPQAAILGVGAARDTLARVDGEIVDRKLLTITLSCDHRILNGADGSRFLFDVKRLLETPLKLAL